MNLNSIIALHQQLQTMLGVTEYDSYLNNMKDWFGHRVTKDFFDERMISLIQGDALEIHNEMMKQIIFSCNGTPAPAPCLSFNIDAKANNKVKEIPSKESSSVELATSVQQNISNYTDGNGNNNRVLVYQGGAMSYEESRNQDQDYITVNLIDSDGLMPYTMVQEQEETQPILPVDWLFNADFVMVNPDEDEKPASFNPPENYSKFALEHNPSEIIRSPGILPNVTHGYDIADRLNKFSNLKPHFKQQPKDQAYLSAGASIHGRFLLKAWECGIDGGVDPNCTKLVVEAVKQHVRRIVLEVAKQRRAFRMRQDKVCHSIGAPYPNPYLLQGHHLYDTAYTSDTVLMADVMQVPAIMPTADELERIAVLQVAAAAPPEDGRFPSTTATLADLRNVIENDPGIIPYTNLRFKMMTDISSQYKGFGGTFSYEDDEDEGELLPICSY